MRFILDIIDVKDVAEFDKPDDRVKISLLHELFQKSSSQNLGIFVISLRGRALFILRGG